MDQREFPNKTHQFILQVTEDIAKPIEIAISLFSQHIMIAISNIGKFGSIIEGRCENWQEQLTQDGYIYDVSTIFGSSEYELYESLARGILDIMYDKEGFEQHLQKKYGIHLDPNRLGNPILGKNIMMFIAMNPQLMKNESQEESLYRTIIEALKVELYNIF